MRTIANIAEILSNMNHTFFTPDSASDFRQANYADEIPVGKIKFLGEMSMDFFERKNSEGTTICALPNDAEMMARIMREIPGFAKA